MALLVALVLVGQGLPAAGCIALGLEFAAGGFVFAAVGALAAQVTTGAGTARGGAAVALAAAYVLAVVGDVSGRTWVSWLSPVGWTRQVHPYGVTRWWVFALVAGFTGLLAAGAFALSARRDVGTGLLPSRPGPADAAAGLRTPLALAWRLHRGLLAGWVVGFALLGVVFGAVTRSIGEMLGGNKQLTEVFQRIGGASGLVDAYLAGIVGFLGLVAAGYAIQAALRLRAEEAAGRSEPVLATAVGRLRWAASHLAFALLGPAAALLAAGLATGLVYGVSTGRPGHEVPRLLAAAAVQLPAVWVLAALTVALVGLRPRLAVVSWGALAGCVLVGLVGSAMGASHWLVDASPFTHVPRTPFGPFTATPLVWLVAVALALGTAGLAGLRRRDVPVA